ncbi:LysR family transcriptional regulator [Rathayibacter soli]|uniref:LysR family transcriptional regulator n=1 Tax=Rathayibacter soli TaxID=3144168 RepID=UPI0027E479E8|nr:LysR family transcriptional regulator [Glaciibacter superstes]
MELRQLEHFLAVAQERHFTRAADALRISQSGLSASIRALETELGASLFTRSTRRVELTQAGVALLTESIRTVASASAAREAVAAVRDVLSGTLTVGTEQCLGAIDLPEQLARFRQQHPGVRINLGFAGSTQLLDALATGRQDLAVLAVCGPTPQGVRLETVSTEPFVVLCSPRCALAAERSTTLADLAAETFVGFQADWAARVLVDRAFDAERLGHTVELEVNDVGTLLDLIEHDLGVAVVPAHFAHKRPERLAAVPLRATGLEWTVAIAIPEQPSPAARALLGQLETA